MGLQAQLGEGRHWIVRRMELGIPIRDITPSGCHWQCIAALPYKAVATLRDRPLYDYVRRRALESGLARFLAASCSIVVTLLQPGIEAGVSEEEQ